MEKKKKKTKVEFEIICNDLPFGYPMPNIAEGKRLEETGACIRHSKKNLGQKEICWKIIK